MVDKRVAIVTGGARGIGLATAQAFARDAAVVCIFDARISPEGEKVARDSGGRMFEVNVSVREGIDRAIAEILAAYERIDVLVNCAGISRDARVWKITPSMWQEVLDVNLTGAWNMIHAVVPAFQKSKRGHVVNVSSVAAFRARPGLSNYAASKAGLLGLTRGAAVDLAPLGVNVNAVAPGFVDTELTAKIPAETRAEILHQTPTGRLTTADDVADAILFLCSDKARQITGEVIRVDGGILA